MPARNERVARQVPEGLNVRYILTGHRRDEWGPTMFISKSGCVAYTAEKAFVYRKLADAQAELAYWSSTGAPKYRWEIEQLPPRMRLANAILRAKPLTEN